MKRILSPLALAAAAVATPIPDSSSALAPPAFKVNNVIYGGSGCPQGSIDVEFSSDGRMLPIYFDKNFVATVGPNVDPVQSRKDCQLNIDLTFSPGFQYTVYSADYTGYADVDAGVKGVVKSSYYFSGEQNGASSSLGITGPFTGRYTKHDDVSMPVWSPCGSEAMLNVNAEVALTPLGSSATGTLTTAKENGKFTNLVYIRWRQC